MPNTETLFDAPYKNQLSKMEDRFSTAEAQPPLKPGMQASVSIVEKNKEKTTTRYIKKIYNEYPSYGLPRSQLDIMRLVVKEVIAGECYRFFDPKQSPKVRALISGNDTCSQNFLGVLSKEIAQYKPAANQLKSAQASFDTLAEEEKQEFLKLAYGNEKHQIATGYFYLRNCNEAHIRQITRLMVSAFIIGEDDLHLTNWGFDKNSKVIKIDNDDTFHPMEGVKYGTIAAIKYIGSEFPNTCASFYRCGEAFKNIGNSGWQKVLNNDMLEAHREEKYYSLTKSLILRDGMIENFASTTIPDINNSKQYVLEIQSQLENNLKTLEAALLMSDEYRTYYQKSSSIWIDRMKLEFNEYNLEFKTHNGNDEIRTNKRHRLIEMEQVDHLFERLGKTIQLDKQSVIQHVNTQDADPCVIQLKNKHKLISKNLLDLNNAASLIASWTKSSVKECMPKNITSMIETKNYIAYKLIDKYKTHLENKNEWRALTIFPFFNYSQRTREAKLQTIKNIISEAKYNDLPTIITTLKNNSIGKHSFWNSNANNNRTDGAMLIKQLEQLQLDKPPIQDTTKIIRYTLSS